MLDMMRLNILAGSKIVGCSLPEFLQWPVERAVKWTKPIHALFGSLKDAAPKIKENTMKLSTAERLVSGPGRVAYGKRRPH